MAAWFQSSNTTEYKTQTRFTMKVTILISFESPNPSGVNPLLLANSLFFKPTVTVVYVTLFPFRLNSFFFPYTSLNTFSASYYSSWASTFISMSRALQACKQIFRANKSKTAICKVIRISNGVISGDFRCCYTAWLKKAMFMVKSRSSTGEYSRDRS